MTWSFPIKEQYRISQKFGEKKLNYSQFNLIAHNGIDVACFRGAGVYAVADGVINYVLDGAKPDAGGYGNTITQLVSWDIPNRFYDVVYGHLLNVFVKVNDKVKQGQLLGFVDSTGFSTGDHLHLGVRDVERRTPQPSDHSVMFNNLAYPVLNYDNGYLGYYDPELLLDNIPDEVLAVDNRYGQEYSATREWLWEKVNLAYARKKANEAGVYFSDRIKKGFVYGYWPQEFIYDPAMYAVWTTMHYPEFNKRINAGVGGLHQGTNPFQPSM